MSDNTTHDDFNKLSEDEKNEALSVADEYFQIQEQEEKQNTVVPIRHGDKIPDEMPIMNKLKQCRNEEERLHLLKKELEKSDIEHGFLDADIDIPDSWMTEKPAEREYIIDGFLPLGVVGILGAKGGTGKSMLAMQMAITIAGGYGGGEFFGHSIQSRGKVLYLSAEDDREECWRRIYSIREQYDNDVKRFPVVDWLQVQQNLKIKSLVGENSLLTTSDAGGTVLPVTQTIDRISNTMNRLDDFKLVIVDTYSRFNGGKENANEDAAMFIKACEQIKKNTGATVLVLAHVRKDSSNAADSESIAGGGRFVDSARWAATMTPYIPEGLAEELDMDEQERLRHIKFRVGKDNYSGGLGASIFMRRGVGGVLAQEDEVIKKQDSSGGRPKSHADIRTNPCYRSAKNNIMDIIAEHERSGKPATKNLIKTRFSGTGDGMIGVSDKIAMRIINAMLEDFDIAERKIIPGGGYGLFIRHDSVDKTL